MWLLYDSIYICAPIKVKRTFLKSQKCFSSPSLLLEIKRWRQRGGITKATDKQGQGESNNKCSYKKWESTGLFFIDVRIGWRQKQKLREKERKRLRDATKNTNDIAFTRVWHNSLPIYNLGSVKDNICRKCLTCTHSKLGRKVLFTSIFAWNDRNEEFTKEE